LVELVEVAEDGSFTLNGFLEPLGPIAENLADTFRRAGEGLASFIGSLDATSIPRITAEFEGLGPLVAALGAGLTAAFAQSIPILGRLFAGFNPIVVGVLALIAASSELRETFSEAFTKVADAVEPLVPQVQELLRGLVSLAEDAGPAIADGLVTIVEALVPLFGSLLSAINDLLPVIGPVLVVALQATADALQIIADILGVIGPELTLITAGVLAFAYAFPVATATIILMTTNMKLMAFQTGIAATAFGTLATAVAVALAAIGSYNAIQAGLSGDMDYLNRDVPFYEKPFQLAGRAGYAIGGGDRDRDARTKELEDGFKAAEDFDVALLGQIETFGEARASAAAYAESIGLTGNGVANFANTVALAWNEQRDIIAEEELASSRVADAYRVQADAYLDFLYARAEEASGGLDLAEEVDLMKELKTATDAAWAAVDRLIMVDSG
ncbi:MAG: hypothetical protein LC687_05165, partial [Actinobacteria bacterium]|nr:hypothetical protein [Actinomycetota bacterium]